MSAVNNFEIALETIYQKDIKYPKSVLYMLSRFIKFNMSLYKMNANYWYS